jgi:hypothetical protein
MNTEELKAWTAKWIRKKRGKKILKEFALERKIPISTLNAHEGKGVLRFDILEKYIDSDEEMLEVFRKFKS